MSIRKRKWRSRQGVEGEAWVVDYVDSGGTRRLKTFARQKDAKTFSDRAGVEVRAGLHIAERASATIASACDLWLKAAAGQKLEPTTIDGYRSHAELHIKPFIGSTKLTALTIPGVRSFEDQLRNAGRSPAMVRKVLVSLGSVLSDSQERGLVIGNVVRDMRRRRGRGENRQERRTRGKLKVGIDIPTRDEIRAIVNHLDGRWRPLLLVAIFTGLRASELRGLRWSDLDLQRSLVHVRQRADRFNEIGRPKSEAGERTVPLPPLVRDTLRDWQSICPKRVSEGGGSDAQRPEELHYVFPNGSGKIEQLNNIVRRGFGPAQLRAGIKKVEAGVEKPKYGGMHSLRHFYASWCINRTQDGGLGLPPKMIQQRMGHSSITLTMDVYGHLFPGDDDGRELAAAEALLLTPAHSIELLNVQSPAGQAG